MVRAVPQRAFTLVEALTALVVLGIAVAAILSPIMAAVEQQTRTMRQTVASVLAEQAIEECLGQKLWSYESSVPDLGPSSEETWRTSYDERSDYHGVTEDAGDFGLRYGTRLSAANFPELTRQFHLQFVYLPGMTSSDPPELMMLTVRVFDSKEELACARRLISKVED